MKETANRIHPDDLTLALLTLDSARTVLSEVSLDYFTADIRNRVLLAHEFSRSRSKVWAVERLLCEIEAELRGLGASTGYADDEMTKIK